jgi:hypothetical protein
VVNYTSLGSSQLRLSICYGHDSTGSGCVVVGNVNCVFNRADSFVGLGTAAAAAETAI